MEEKKKGLTAEECVKKARKYIEKYGICLLVFDVVGSRYSLDPNQLTKELKLMMQSLNRKFYRYFPKNDLAVRSQFEKGFERIFRGDCACAGINNAEIIPKIIAYQKEKYPDIPLYWAVAKDGYTKKDWEVI